MYVVNTGVEVLQDFNNRRLGWVAGAVRQLQRVEVRRRKYMRSEKYDRRSTNLETVDKYEIGW